MTVDQSTLIAQLRQQAETDTAVLAALEADVRRLTTEREEAELALLDMTRQRDDAQTDRLADGVTIGRLRHEARTLSATLDNAVSERDDAQREVATLTIERDKLQGVLEGSNRNRARERAERDDARAALHEILGHVAAHLDHDTLFATDALTRIRRAARRALGEDA